MLFIFFFRSLKAKSTELPVKPTTAMPLTTKEAAITKSPKFFEAQLLIYENHIADLEIKLAKYRREK